MNQRAFTAFVLFVVVLVLGLVCHLYAIGVWADLLAALAEIREGL